MTEDREQAFETERLYFAETIHALEQKLERAIDNCDELKVQNFLHHGDDIDALNASYSEIYDIEHEIAQVKARFEAAIEAHHLAAVSAMAVQRYQHAEFSAFGICIDNPCTRTFLNNQGDST
jgi:hypothetical protein